MNDHVVENPKKKKGLFSSYIHTYNELILKTVQFTKLTWGFKKKNGYIKGTVTAHSNLEAYMFMLLCQLIWWFKQSFIVQKN